MNNDIVRLTTLLAEHCVRLSERVCYTECNFYSTPRLVAIMSLAPDQVFIGGKKLHAVKQSFSDNFLTTSRMIDMNNAAKSCYCQNEHVASKVNTRSQHDVLSVKRSFERVPFIWTKGKTEIYIALRDQALLYSFAKLAYGAMPTPVVSYRDTHGIASRGRTKCRHVIGWLANEWHTPINVAREPEYRFGTPK